MNLSSDCPFVAVFPLRAPQFVALGTVEPCRRDLNARHISQPTRCLFATMCPLRALLHYVALAYGRFVYEAHCHRVYTRDAPSYLPLSRCVPTMSTFVCCFGIELNVFFSFLVAAI